MGIELYSHTQIYKPFSIEYDFWLNAQEKEEQQKFNPGQDQHLFKWKYVICIIRNCILPSIASSDNVFSLLHS